MAGLAGETLVVRITVIDRATGVFMKLDARMKAFNARIKASRGMMMGIGFGMLFAGMALKMAAEGALRSMMTVYKAANENSNILLNTTNRLQAAFVFLKFQIMDALSQSDLFIGMIENLITFIDWIGSMDEETRASMGGFLVIAAVIGSILSPLGQVSLLAMSTGAGMGVMLGIILLIIVAIFMLWQFFSIGVGEATGATATWIKVLKVVIIVLFAILVVIGIVMGGWVLVVVAAMVALIAIVWNWRDEIVDAMKSAVEWIVNAWNDAINFIIDGLNKIIDLMNKIPGVSIGHIPNIGGGDLPEFASGGFVPRTGPAILHAGEFVMSKQMLESGGGGGGLTVGDINVSVSGETSDADRLAEIVSERILNEFERYTHRGGK